MGSEVLARPINNQDMVNALNRLIAAEYQIIVTFEKAAEKLKRDKLRKQLLKFSADHRHHVRLLVDQVLYLGGAPYPYADKTNLISKCKVVLASFIADRLIVRIVRVCANKLFSRYEQAIERLKASQELADLLFPLRQRALNHHEWLTLINQRREKL